MYQRDLKQAAADYFGVSIDAMDLPHEAWALLRDHYISKMATPSYPEDRPRPTYTSARESAIDEQAAMYDDSDGDASWPDDNTYHFMKE